MENCLKIFVLLLILPQFLQAQIYKGKIIETDTEIPIRYANVFLAGTLLGTTTDSLGNFEFNAKGNYTVPIVISFVGYETKVMSNYELASNSTIRLKKGVLNIDEIDVKSNRSSWPRSRMLYVFKEEFLGTSYNAQSCKILNEDEIYLYYNSDSETLHAHSNSPLVIENKLLNYKITYLLKDFQKSKSGVKFTGYSSFAELKVKNEKHKERISQQRRDTYLGSVLHFIRNLANDNFYDEDTIYDVNTIKKIYANHGYIAGSLSENYNGDFTSTVRMSKNEINNILIRKYQNLFQLYDSLGNYISNSKILIDSVGTRWLNSNQAIEIKYLGSLRNSYLIPKSAFVEISKNGYYDPELISWFGFVSNFRVGDLLPFDYEYIEYVSRKKFLFN